MQSKYMLNKRRAKNQIKAQKISIKLFYYWFGYSVITIGLVLLKFAFGNPNISKYSNFYLVLVIVIYFLLFFAETVAALRTFLILCQFQFSALYLHNCLNTLNDKIDKIRISKLNQMNLNKLADHILNTYNVILRNQRKVVLSSLSNIENFKGDNNF